MINVYIMSGYYIAINLIAFIIYGIDKRRAIKNRYRVPEKTLLALAFLGGALGAVLGMYTFRHKTRKLKFTVLVPVFLIVHIIIVGMVLN